jgi:NarL family two-component system response regulator LiaR
VRERHDAPQRYRFGVPLAAVPTLSWQPRESAVATSPLAVAVRLLHRPRPMIRVLVADDHAMFREMLRIALPRNGDIDVVGEASDGQELPDVLYRTRPDVVLLDYKMPYVRDFVGMLQQLSGRYPDTRFIVLSGFFSSDIATRAAEGHARGYVLKTTRLAAVADAIRTVASGGVWIDASLPRKVFDIFQRQAARQVNGADLSGALTRREYEILATAAAGISNVAIAEKLCISEQTVKTHLSRVYAKLGVKNRLAAALVFYSKGDAVGAPSDGEALRQAAAK